MRFTPARAAVVVLALACFGVPALIAQEEPAPPAPAAADAPAPRTPDEIYSDLSRPTGPHSSVRAGGDSQRPAIPSRA